MIKMKFWIYYDIEYWRGSCLRQLTYVPMEEIQSYYFEQGYEVSFLLLMYGKYILTL